LQVYSPIHQRSTDLSSNANESILDYLREIIEEGLNLDVTGGALLERFSVQCVSESAVPGVVELAKGLGISRFSSSGVVSGGEGMLNTVVVAGDSDTMVKLHVLRSMPLASTENELR